MKGEGTRFLYPILTNDKEMGYGTLESLILLVC